MAYFLICKLVILTKKKDNNDKRQDQLANCYFFYLLSDKIVLAIKIYTFVEPYILEFPPCKHLQS